MNRKVSMRLIRLFAIITMAYLVALASLFALPRVSKANAIVTPATSGSPSSHPNAKPALQTTPSPYIVLMGAKKDIDAVTAPFIADGSLQYLRNYPTSINWIAESPTPGTHGKPGQIQLWRHVTPTTGITDVIDAVIDAANTNSVTLEYMDTSWLTYMPQEIVLTGSNAEMQDAINWLNSAGISFQISVQVAFPGTPERIRCLTLMTSPLNPNQTVSNIVIQINSLGSEVKAEPNFLVSSAGEHIHGSPGGPQLDGGNPFTATSPLTETGDGISVFVFDTVPYTLPVSTVLPQSESIDGVPISVWRPLTLPTNLPEGPWQVPAHGTFVTNRVTEIAPDADINLVEVLDETGTGTLCHFLNALDFAVDQLQTKGQQKAVFNYSLTVDGRSEQGQSPALEFAISYLNGRRIMQVGAAGNDSASSAKPQDMRLPAAHPNVIGVTSIARVQSSKASASPLAGRRKIVCYANRGNFGLRGGGIVTEDGLCNTEQLVNFCEANPNAKACVTGWSPDSNSDYEWGMGTSFAAPIMAGYAAQMIEKKAAAQPNVARSAAPPTPAQIRRALRQLAASDCDSNNPDSELVSLDDCSVYLPTVLK